MGQLNSLPGLWTSNTYVLKTQMKPHWSCLGCLDIEAMASHQNPDIQPLHECLANDFQLKDTFLPGCLHHTVNTGCSISCSPDKKDFESISCLEKSIQMSGVTGKFAYKYGGIIWMEVFKTNGEVTTLCTPGYWNPHQQVQFFSPQYHLSLMPEEQGSFIVSWTKLCLDIPDLGQLLVHIDPDSHMPLLQCFHDTETLLLNLANPCVTDESNLKLTTVQKLRLCLHFKVGHTSSALHHFKNQPL